MSCRAGSRSQSRVCVGHGDGYVGRRASVRMGCQAGFAWVLKLDPRGSQRWVCRGRRVGSMSVTELGQCGLWWIWVCMDRRPGCCWITICHEGLMSLLSRTEYIINSSSMRLWRPIRCTRKFLLFIVIMILTQLRNMIIARLD
jgi:hypothetical protein